MKISYSSYWSPLFLSELLSVFIIPFPLPFFLPLLCIPQWMPTNTQHRFLHCLDLADAYWYHIHKPWQTLPKYLSHVDASILLCNFFLRFCYKSCLATNLSYPLASNLSLWAFAYDICRSLPDPIQMDRIHVAFVVHNRSIQQFASLQSSSLPALVFHQWILKHSFSFLPRHVSVPLYLVRTNLMEYWASFANERFLFLTTEPEIHYWSIEFLAYACRIRSMRSWVCLFDLYSTSFLLWGYRLFEDTSSLVIHTFRDLAFLFLTAHAILFSVLIEIRVIELFFYNKSIPA